MIGFYDFDETFSLTTIQALQDYADGEYIQNPAAPIAPTDFSASDDLNGRVECTWTHDTVGFPIPIYDLYEDDTQIVTNISSPYSHSVSQGTRNYFVRLTNTEGTVDSNTDEGTALESGYDNSGPLYVLPLEDVHGFPGDGQGGTEYQLTATDEVYTHENLLWEGLSPIGGIINIGGISGANQTVIIRDSKFVGADTYAIRCNHVDNIIIEGNLLDGTSSFFQLYDFKNVTIRYNKIKNHALMSPSVNWDGSHDHVAHVWSLNDSTYDSMDISYNLVDRSADPRDFNVSDEAKHELAWCQDWCNWRHLEASDPVNGRGKVYNNILAGSEWGGEGNLGGGMIADSHTKHIDYYDNVILNTTGTLYSSANSGKLTFDNCIGYHTEKASLNLTIRATSSWPGYNSQSNQTWGFRFEVYEQNGVGPLEEHIITNCRILAKRQGQSVSYMSAADDQGVDAKNNVLTDTNYIATSNNSWDWTYHADGIREVSYSSGDVHAFRHYFYDNNTPVGALPYPDAEEMFQYIFGMSYADATFSTATDGKMFAKWGTDINSPKYFDESRTVTRKDK